MQQIDHCAPLRRPHGVPTVAPAAASCLAFLFFTGPARAQLDWYVQFESPSYVNSPMGVPLAGQDGWYQVGPPGGGEWKVYSNGNNVLGVPNNTAGLTGFAGVVIDPNAPGFPEPVAIERSVPFSFKPYFTIDILIDHSGPAPTSRDIARISFEPEEFSASLALVPAWVDPGKPDAWRLEVVFYNAAGLRQQAVPPDPGFAAMAAGQWFEVDIQCDIILSKIVSIIMREKTTGSLLARYDPTDWYLRGGVVGMGKPSAVRVTCISPSMAVVGLDNLYTLKGPCYADCDRDGGLWFFDFLCFQNLFLAGDPYADCDGSGQIDFFDFICFSNNFSGGCFP